MLNPSTSFPRQGVCALLGGPHPATQHSARRIAALLRRVAGLRGPGRMIRRKGIETFLAELDDRARR